MDFTATGLLQVIRDYVSLPPWSDSSTNAKLLRLLNREQMLTIQKMLLSARKEYRTAILDVPVVSGQLVYPIPPRAITSGLKMIQGIDASGGAWMLWEIPEDNVPWPRSFMAPSGQFFLRGNTLNWYQPPQYAYLRFSYPRRLSELTTDGADFSTIATITTATKTITVSPALTSASGTFDLVQANPQFDLMAADAVATGSTTTTLVFSATLPTNLAVGDYACVPQKSPVCLAPLELHAVLALRVAQKVVMAKGDPQSPAISSDLHEAMSIAASMLEPRPEKVRASKNPAAPGMSRWGNRGWWGTNY